MINFLIIECLIVMVLGAVAFRIMWAMTKNMKISWSVMGIFALLTLFISHNVMPEGTTVQKGAQVIFIVPPLVIDFSRIFCLLLGAALTARVIAYRQKIGLEDDHPDYKDFP